MRVLFAGTPEVAVPTLRWLMESEHEVVGVLTRADARQGRGRTLHPSPVAAISREAGIETRTPATLRDPEVAAWVKGLEADVAVVVAYGRLVPADLLEAPRHGWLNLHFSLLPAWRGAAPVQRAVMAGDERTGACVFRLEEGLDTGPILAQMSTGIGLQETAGDLLGRLAQEGIALVEESLAALEAGTAVFRPQASEGVSLAPQLSTGDGEVDWERSAAEIDCLVRGVTPAPGAYTRYEGLRLRLGPVSLLEPGREVPDLAPGEVFATKREVLVGVGAGTGEGPRALRLGEVAPAGKKWMDAAAWARGARLAPGTRLGEAFEAASSQTAEGGLA